MTAVSFISIVFPQFVASEWQTGVSIYRAGGVTSFSIFGDLVSARVRAGIGETYDVHVKLHGGGKGVQWMECTCQPYRRKGIKCGHLAAVCMALDQDHAEVLRSRNLGSGEGERYLFTSGEASPAVPAGAVPAATATVEQRMSDLPSDRLIHLDFDAGNECFLVTLAVGRGEKITCKVGVDDAFVLARRPEVRDVLSARMRNLLKSRHEAVRCFDVRWVGPDAVRVTRCVRFMDGSDVLTPIDKFPQNLVGRDVLLDLKAGFIPLTDGMNLSQLSRWNDYPPTGVLTGDQAALLFESGFAVLRDTAEIRLAPGMEELQVASQVRFQKLSLEASDEAGFRVSIDRSGNGPSLLDIMRARAQGREFVRTENGWIRISGEFDWLAQRMNEQGAASLTPIELVRFREKFAPDSEISGRGKTVEQLRRGLKSFDEVEVPSLAHTNLTLRPYQESGFKWLWWLYENRFGGLLCDEMGLGKTHQAMALAAAIAATETRWQILVVCPTSVIDHWLDKLARFVPSVPAVCYHGPNRRNELSRKTSGSRLFVTSYGILLRDVDALMQLDWRLVILDEAHLVKNQMTRTYRAAFRLVSRMRLCLTGTPLENDLMELKNIFDFLIPSYLGNDLEFRRKYLSEGDRRDPVRDLELQRLVHPFKLRRKKSDVLQDLPEKVEDVRHCHLRREQKKLYEEALALRGASLVEQLQNADAAIPYVHVFAVITLLKQICDDPGLVDPRYDGVGSGKLEAFDELLDEALSSGQKVVVFSQYAKMVERLGQRLSRKGISYVELTGSTQKRGQVVKEFQENDEVKVFLGSLLAGGTGIDLTAASVVIHFDRWWNAAKENQATDRIHRIGQTRNVQVYKLITRGTLEDRIDAIIARKQEIFERFVDGGRDAFHALSRDDLLKLLAGPEADDRIVDEEDDASPAQPPAKSEWPGDSVLDLS